MALESATYISDLVSTNPVGATDTKATLDDHIRLTKSTVKATFPNISGAVTPTHTELNYVDGVTSAIQTQINATNAALAAAQFTTALPSQTGNSGKVVTTDGTTASWTSAFVSTVNGASGAVTISSDIVRSARTADTILGTADKTALIDVTSGTFSQTFTAAATLGSGWFCYYRNSGTGIVTLDPDAAETVDGAATLPVYPDQTRLIQCDGTAFRTILISGYVGDHEVVVVTGNGSGSTNTKIRRFTTTQSNVGSAITYADSATLGGSFTINAPGLYALYYTDLDGAGANQYLGISLNSAQLTTDIQTITAANRLTLRQIKSVDQPVGASRIVRLAAGDVIRAHWGSIAPTGTTHVMFAIRKVGA